MNTRPLIAGERVRVSPDGVAAGLSRRQNNGMVMLRNIATGTITVRRDGAERNEVCLERFWERANESR